MEQNFQLAARTMVMDYFNKHKDATDAYVMTLNETYVVWFSKTLQNWKALVSTNVPDGVYYEVTHDGDTAVTYLDVYKKLENVVIRDEDVPEEGIIVTTPQDLDPENQTGPEVKGVKEEAWRSGGARF